MKKIFKILILLLLSINSPSDTLDETSLQLSSSMKGVSTLSHLSFFEDKTKKMNIEEIKNVKFKTENNFHFNKGESSSNWWLKFQVKNPTNKPIDWVLKFFYGQFDELQSWQYDQNNTLLSHFLKGDHFTDSSKTAFLEQLSFDYVTQAKAENTVYVKISYENSGLMELFHSISSKDEFIKSQQLDFNILVGIISALSILLFYNIFIWFILRKKEYFWYNIYLLSVILTVLTYNQIGAYYLWNKSLYLIDIMPFISVVALFSSFILFTREFLETFKCLPRIDKILKILLISDLLSLLLLILGQRHLAIVILQISSFAFILFPILGFILWYRGYKIARGYTMASLVISTAIIISILRVSETLQTSEFLFWITRFGFVIEGILLSIALADRITILENNYINEQNKVKHTLEEAKKNLESEVKKRTYELEIQTRKAEKMARTDEMTGIYNRRAFLEYGETLVYNATRYKTNFSLIMIDLDFFKTINDTYGHDAGDTVLIAFTQEIKKHLRDSDFFARIGGEEFVILLPYTSSSQAFDKANILLKKISELKILNKDFVIKVTASMGIGECVEKEDNLYSVLAKADKALYYAKENGRNSVYIERS